MPAPKFELRLAEDGLRGGHGKVAGKHELEAAGQGRAVHRGYRRLRQLPKGHDALEVGFQQGRPLGDALRR